MTLADARVELVESLDERVRALVRSEGVDPQRDAVVVRRIAESVVREHDEHSLTGAVAPVPDIDAVVGELVGAGVRVRAAPAVPRRPGRRRDLDQRPQPGLHRPQRASRAHQPDALLRAGAGAGRADAQVERSPDRHQPAVRRRDAPRGAPAPRRARRHQPRLLRGQHPQVRAPRRPPRGPGRAGQPHSRRGPVPRGLGPGRAQHPGRRRHPGWEDNDVELPGRRHPRAASAW